MVRPGGLGKGLGALIPASDGHVATSPDRDGGARLEEIPIDLIDPNPHQPRAHFDEQTLSDLAASIAEVGVLQPILVRPGVDDRLELIAGERRWRAARRAGLTMIPAVIRPTEDVASVEQALVENLHREDLTPLEEAAAYQQLIEDFSLTHEQVAARVGRSRSAVTNTLRLLSLPPSIQHLLADGRLSGGHARALLGTPDRAFQEAVARQAVAEGWSVRAVEEAVRARATSATGDAAAEVAATQQRPGLVPASSLRPPGLLELEHLLSDHLDTRVAVAMGARRGKLTIEFADLDDLERIYRVMVEGRHIDDGLKPSPSDE